MSILYAFQATGNGHASRAKVIIPLLRKYAPVDVLASGTQSHLLHEMDLDYRLEGMSFIYGQQGNLNYTSTLSQLKPRQLWQDIQNFPLSKYRLIINDFEPVTAWAARKSRQKLIGLSHQASLLSPKSPQPSKPSWLGKFILHHFAPAAVNYGFHFHAYDQDIFTPIIKSEIRQLKPQPTEKIMVYLPAVDDWHLIKVFIRIPDKHWLIFSRTCHKEFSFHNITIKPISTSGWVSNLDSSEGVIMGAGFEGPAEILHLGLKLLIMPIKGQYEQYCNALALAQLGVPVIFAANQLTPEFIHGWLSHSKAIKMDYQDHTEDILQLLIQRHY